MGARTLYHVTKSSSVPSILKRGIAPLHPSNWVTGVGKRYGEGEIFAFEHIADAMRWASRMDWGLHQKLGTKKISIVEFIDDGKWQVDKSDPISQIGRKGNWLKKFGSVKAENIVSSKPFTQAMVKKVVASNPPEFIIVKTYGGPNPNEDPEKHVTFRIAEDLATAYNNSSLTIHIDDIRKFTKGIPDIHEAFGLSPLDRWQEIIHPVQVDRPIEIAIIASLLVDSNLGNDEREQVQLEFIRAAVRELNARGVYGLFTRGDSADYFRLLKKEGFTDTGVKDRSGYRIYAKILGARNVENNPENPIRLDFLSSGTVSSGMKGFVYADEPRRVSWFVNEKTGDPHHVQVHQALGENRLPIYTLSYINGVIDIVVMCNKPLDVNEILSNLDIGHDQPEVIIWHQTNKAWSGTISQLRATARSMSTSQNPSNRRGS